ncbi:FERM domain-containing protein 5-like isoform X2 [Babylonia areolata]|uniref:FERM domain-containing protein 5-like isoform X2 n=1 Tax=Babylonia areolata TaxID=304850 RepID=UPI003FD1CFEC
MFKKRSKTDLQSEYTCSVRFLDDEPMQFTFKKDTIGQWLFDRVSEKLNLMEKDYFGLRYVDAEKQRHWLDPLKTVYKQLKGINPMVLCFRVKFYPEDPMKLHEEITRYYMFLQLRRDLHHGRLLCSPDDAVTLAAFVVQSEVGDYDPEDHPPGYISEFKMLPKQTPKLEERVMEQHKSLHGQVPSEAEGNFLKKACTLDTYGVDPHQVKDQRGDQLYLGITHQGIMTFRGSRRTQLFKWNQIRRIAYEGKMFIVHISITEDDDTGTAKKKQQPISFKCQTPAASKYLWRCAVEQQLFFTLSSSNSAPKLRSGGSLFSRGSKFRFSGRCQTEAYEASREIHRQEPNFQRSSSLPNFARRRPSDSNRNSTLGSKDVTSESLPEDRRPYNEVAVDVPRQTTTAQRKSEGALEPSPVVLAPLAATEKYDEHKQQQRKAAVPTELIVPSSAATTAAAPPPRLNGQAVLDSPEMATGDPDTSFETGTYQPDNTFYEDEDEEEEEEEAGKPKPSLEEEIQQLDADFSRQEQDQLAAAAAAGTLPQTAVAPAKKKRSGVCGALVASSLVALLLFAVLFYVVFFSGLEHPVLSQIRGHLGFLEPLRDFVGETTDSVASYFRK